MHALKRIRRMYTIVHFLKTKYLTQIELELKGVVQVRRRHQERAGGGHRKHVVYANKEGHNRISCPALSQNGGNVVGDEYDGGYGDVGMIDMDLN
ncbi:hypothetical protein TSUD_136000 [Trifolium subterraneum]|uniref:Uncharacterized protein n=1 Tax=Trifolium subterraneum TaxID=3900 RepID=A0A2Z6NV05_TRISU|nr:hypothetical protein TSUD_136000 [Trifolium subterraneum]